MPVPTTPDHPLLTGSEPCSLITADLPRYPSAPGGNAAMSQDLKAYGLRHEATKGAYGTPENSFIVYGARPEVVAQLGRKYGQEAIVHCEGGRRSLVYTNGLHAGYANPGLHSFQVFSEEPEDYFTAVPGVGYVRLHFDDRKLVPFLPHLARPGSGGQ